MAVPASDTAAPWGHADSVSAFKIDSDMPSHDDDDDSHDAFAVRGDTVSSEDDWSRVVQSHGAFISLQQFVLEYHQQRTQYMTDGHTSERQQQHAWSKTSLTRKLRETCNSYRALLDEQVASLQRIYRNDDTKTELRERATLLKQEQVILHLFEIFYIDVSHQIVPLLVEFISVTQPDPYNRVVRKQMEQNTYYKDNTLSSEAWKVIYKKVMNGDTRTALLLLKPYLDDLKRSVSTPDNGNSDIDDASSETHKSDHNSNFYSFFEEIMLSMPRFDSRSLLSDHIARMNQWRSDCEEVLDWQQTHYSDKTELGDILSILTGDLDVIEKCVLDEGDEELEPRPMFWDKLSAHLLYINPSASRRDIHHIVEELIDMDDVDHISTFDAVLIPIMDISIGASYVLERIQKVYDDPWFTAHLTDILWHCEAIKPNASLSDEDGKVDLREKSLLKYAKMIIGDTSLWHVALDYLSFCYERGAHYIQELITEIPMESEYKLRKLDAFIDRYHRHFAIYGDTTIKPLEEQRKALHAKYGKHVIKNHKRYALGLRHLMIAQDGSHISNLVDKVMDKYLTARTHASEDVKKSNSTTIPGETMTDFHDTLEDIKSIAAIARSGGFHAIIGSDGFASKDRKYAEKLAFICKYADLQEHLEAKQWREAADLIVLLLRSSAVSSADEQLYQPSYSTQFSAPVSLRRFWVMLLTHAVMLLENTQEILFDVQDTYEMMSYVGQLTESHKAHDYLKGMEANLPYIHLALTRNLSRALLVSPLFPQQNRMNPLNRINIMTTGTETGMQE